MLADTLIVLKEGAEVLTRAVTRSYGEISYFLDDEVEEKKANKNDEESKKSSHRGHREKREKKDKESPSDDDESTAGH